MRTLIMGYGHMGKIYEKEIKALKPDMELEIYDPAIEGKKELNTNVDFAIITSPALDHMWCYRKLSSGVYSNREILISKPVCLKEDDLEILFPVMVNAPIFAGMTERYNPAYRELKKSIALSNVLDMTFYRSAQKRSSLPLLFELGIHDLDLFVDLFNFKSEWRERYFNGLFNDAYSYPEKRDLFQILFEGITIDFNWEWTDKERESFIKVTLKNGEKIIVDLKKMSFTSSENSHFFSANERSVRYQLFDFYSGEKCDARVSHELMFWIADKYKIDV